jgi:hypothetical protein
MRGAIVAARLAYPDVMHFEVRDSAGGTWRFATEDAEFAPTDPSELVGKAVEAAACTTTTPQGTRSLRCRRTQRARTERRRTHCRLPSPYTPIGRVRCCGKRTRGSVVAKRIDVLWAARNSIAERAMAAAVSSVSGTQPSTVAITGSSGPGKSWQRPVTSSS